MTGEGIADVTVRLGDDEKLGLAGEELEQTTDGEGRYRFAHAPPGTLWVQARAQGRATRTASGRVDAAASDAGPAVMDDLWLPEGGSASGRVVNADGNPVAGARVVIHAVDNLDGAHSDRYGTSVTTSDAGGGFRFDGIAAGTRYRVRAHADGHASGATSPFPIESGAEIEGLRVVLGNGATLRGSAGRARQRRDVAPAPGGRRRARRHERDRASRIRGRPVG
jgi:hypothetical protein